MKRSYLVFILLSIMYALSSVPNFITPVYGNPCNLENGKWSEWVEIDLNRFTKEYTRDEINLNDKLNDPLVDWGKLEIRSFWVDNKMVTCFIGVHWLRHKFALPHAKYGYYHAIGYDPNDPSTLDPAYDGAINILNYKTYLKDPPYEILCPDCPKEHVAYQPGGITEMHYEHAKLQIVPLRPVNWPPGQELPPQPMRYQIRLYLDCKCATAVPEPATVTMLLFGALGLAFKRRVIK